MSCVKSLEGPVNSGRPAEACGFGHFRTQNRSSFFFFFYEVSAPLGSTRG